MGMGTSTLYRGLRRCLSMSLYESRCLSTPKIAGGIYDCDGTTDASMWSLTGKLCPPLDIALILVLYRFRLMPI